MPGQSPKQDDTASAATLLTAGAAKGGDGDWDMFTTTQQARKTWRKKLKGITKMAWETFWFLPLLSMMLNAALAIAMTAASTTFDQDALLDFAPEECLACVFIFTGSATDAKALLALVSGAAVSIATLTFSLTVLSIQLAAVNFSPRLLDEFIKDDVAKWSFAVNLGTFVYCFVTLWNTYEESDLSPPFVPYVAVNVAMLHMWTVVIMFVVFIEHFVNSLRLERMMAKASHSASQAATRLRVLDDTEEKAKVPRVPPGAQRALADGSGYVSAWSMSRAVDQAKRLDVVVRYAVCSGQFVTEGTLIGWVWPRDEDSAALASRVREHCADEMKEIQRQQQRLQADDKIASDGAAALRHRKAQRHEEAERKGRGHDNGGQRAENDEDVAEGEEDSASSEFDDEDVIRLVLWRLVNSGVQLTVSRGRDNDVSLGIQQIADIAVRALSPGVNDPHSATQAIDSLSVIFARITVSEFARSLARDDDDVMRLVAPVRGFSYMLALCMDSIRAYGAGDASVVRRAMYFLGDVGSIAARVQRPERVRAAQTQLEQWRQVAESKLGAGSTEMAAISDVYKHALHVIETADSHVVPEGEGREHHDEDELEGHHDGAQEEEEEEEEEESGRGEEDAAPRVPVDDTSVMGILRTAVNDIV